MQNEVNHFQSPIFPLLSQLTRTNYMAPAPPTPPTPARQFAGIDKCQFYFPLSLTDIGGRFFNSRRPTFSGHYAKTFLCTPLEWRRR